MFISESKSSFMSQYKFKKSFRFILAGCLFLVFLFASCSQTTPELSMANYSVIFEFEDNETYPDSRLSIFMESTTDVRRYERVTVTSVENGYTWNIDDISKIITDSRQWAGNTNLVVPEGEIIPDGMYKVTYINADEKEATLYVHVKYDSEIYNMTAEEIPSYIVGKDGRCSTIIYDEFKNILYYGDKIPDFNTTRGIWNTFRDAATYRDIYYTPGRFVICIMPEQKVALD